jgi:hypothetical protein
MDSDTHLWRRTKNYSEMLLLSTDLCYRAHVHALHKTGAGNAGGGRAKRCARVLTSYIWTFIRISIQSKKADERAARQAWIARTPVFMRVSGDPEAMTPCTQRCAYFRS